MKQTTKFARVRLVRFDSQMVCSWASVTNGAIVRAGVRKVGK